MTPEEAATELTCWSCGGPVRAMSRPWWFRCLACEITIRPDDIGQLQYAIARQVLVRSGRVARDG